MHAGEGADFVLSSGSYRLRSVLASDSPPSCRDFPVHLNYWAAVMGNHLFLCPPPPPPQHFYTFIQKGTCLLTCIYVCVNTHTQSRSCFCGTKAKRFCYISENKTQQAVLCLKLNEWLAILVCKYEVLMDTTAKVYMAEELQKQKCWLTGYYFLVTTPAKGQT